MLLKEIDYNYPPIEIKESVSTCGKIISESEHYCLVDGTCVAQSGAIDFAEGLWKRGLVIVGEGRNGPLCLKIKSLKKALESHNLE